jgi:hypothetical protein
MPPANGYVTDKRAIKIFVSSVIFTNATCYAFLDAFIMPTRDFNMAASTFFLEPQLDA